MTSLIQILISCRCLFNVTHFVADNGLTLTGLSLIRSQRSMYVQYARNTPESDVCADELPCDDGDSDAGSISRSITALLTTVSIVALALH